jgi:hypothetical protein
LLTIVAENPQRARTIREQMPRLKRGGEGIAATTENIKASIQDRRPLNMPRLSGGGRQCSLEVVPPLAGISTAGLSAGSSRTNKSRRATKFRMDVVMRARTMRSIWVSPSNNG